MEYEATRRCAVCGKPLTTVNRADNNGAFAQLKYCSKKCKQKAANDKYYKKNKETMISRILNNRKKNRKEGKNA